MGRYRGERKPPVALRPPAARLYQCVFFYSFSLIVRILCKGRYAVYPADVDLGLGNRIKFVLVGGKAPAGHVVGDRTFVIEERVQGFLCDPPPYQIEETDRKSTRLNSSHV